MEIRKYLSSQKKIIDEALDYYLPKASEYPQIIHEAMRYGVFPGGKRIRAILVLAAGEAVNGEKEELLDAAAAIELIHSYSLIHDDLPAIDDDDFRRGKPACHKKFNDAIAILAGDALLTYAFYLLSKSKNSPDKVIKVCEEISMAIGTFGMIGGQVVDIEYEGKNLDVPTLEYIHTHKTGALIATAVRVGGILGNGDEKQLHSLTQYGKHIGLSFQIVDDLLDIEEVGKKGKKRKSDLFKKKLTYPAVYGVESSKKQVDLLIEEALDAIATFNHKAEPLRAIAKFIGKRRY